MRCGECLLYRCHDIEGIPWRRVALFFLSRERQRCRKGVGNLHIHVRTEVETLEVRTVCAPHTTLVEIAQRCKIACFLCSTAHVKVVLLLRSPWSYHLIIPVGAFVALATSAPFFKVFASVSGLFATVNQVFIG